MKARKAMVLLALVSAVLSGPAAFGQAQELTGAGATFPEPLYSKMFDVYYSQTGTKVNYQGIGSGGGIQQVYQKTVDFGGTDAFLTDQELAKAGGEQIVHVPTCIGAVVVTFNVPGIAQLKLTPTAVADLFLGKIKVWNDARIASLNPGVNIPAMPVSVVHRSDGSGTTFVFTDYLSKVSPEWKQRVGAAKAVKWPAGIGGKGNPGVAALVKQTRGGVGYVELSFAEKNKMPYASVKNSSGNFVTPSLASASLAATQNMPADTRATVTDTGAKDGYPISSFTWIILYKEQNYGGRTADKAKALAKLLWWMTHEGQAHCRDLLYAPLPKDAVAKAEAVVKSLSFNGKPLL